MLQQVWSGADRKITVCIDSYEKGIPKGRLYSGHGEEDAFESLIQFLLGVEALLDGQQTPQSYTARRKFSDYRSSREAAAIHGQNRMGDRATFDVQVLYRQHTSWQGVLLWRDCNMEQSFRSALELVLLMDSALRNQEEEVAS